MEFEKKTNNFSFGAGSLKTAGAGSIDKSSEVPDIPTKHDPIAIAKSVGNAAIALALLRMKKKHDRKHID